MMPVTQYHSKIRATKLQKSAKFCLTWYFSFADLLTEAQIRYQKTFKFGTEHFLRKIK